MEFYATNGNHFGTHTHSIPLGSFLGSSEDLRKVKGGGGSIIVVHLQMEVLKATVERFYDRKGRRPGMVAPKS